MSIPPAVRPFSSALLAAALLLSPLSAAPALAAWTLDPAASSLSFVSVKKGDVGEVHHFTKLAGSVADNGTATLRVDLASVETWTDIRNERMRDFLFEVAKFPAATVTVNFDAAAQRTLKALKPGAVTAVAAPLTLSLHGVTRKIDAELQVSRLGPTRVQVTPKELVVLDAREFGLADGIRKLMELAALPSISAAVPVTFSLIFDDTGKK